MKFGVIVCPSCRQTKGIELTLKTTKCNRCGKILLIKKLKIFYETDSQKTLIKAIGLVNVKLHKKYDNYKN